MQTFQSHFSFFTLVFPLLLLFFFIIFHLIFNNSIKVLFLFHFPSTTTSVLNLIFAWKSVHDGANKIELHFNLICMQPQQQQQQQHKKVGISTKLKISSFLLLSFFSIIMLLLEILIDAKVFQSVFTSFLSLIYTI